MLQSKHLITKPIFQHKHPKFLTYVSKWEMSEGKSSTKAQQEEFIRGQENKTKMQLQETLSLVFFTVHWEIPPF